MASPDDLRTRRKRRNSLSVEVTSRCNRDCTYCYNVWKADDAYPLEELPTTELVQLVGDALRASGISSVQISGGEPLLRPELFDIIEGIRAFGVDLSLVSDGGLIDATVVSQLVRFGVQPVQPTLLAADRDIHNAIKGADCFDATVAAIGRLLRAGVPVSVAYVCTSRNYDHFESVVELCFALGVKTIAFNRLCLTGEGGKRRDEIAPTVDMIVSCLEKADWANAHLGMNVSIAISLPHCVVDTSRYENLTFGHCSILTSAPGFTIDSAGNLRACSVSPTILGNLRTDSWDAILARSRDGYFAEMAAVPDMCRECALHSRCGGGCRESAISCSGSAQSPDPLARRSLSRRTA